MEKRLIELRKVIKAKQPNFVRSYFRRKKNLKECWRKPNGLHNKVRLCHRGHSSRIEIGYGSPREVKGLSREGLKFVTVANVSQLKDLDSKSQTIIIPSSVGNKKRVEILSQAKTIGIKVYNYKDVDKKLNLITQSLKDSKDNSENVKRRVRDRLSRTSKKEDKHKDEDKKSEVKKEVKKKETKTEDKTE